MRLLKTGSGGELILTEFPNETIPPPYAILSHTWDEQEVLFEDIQNGNYRGKLGHKKIQFCASQARKDNLEYFWVDTCCINKAHHTELSESIVSMFRWYSGAAKCYVYLADVPFSAKRNRDGEQRWRSSLRKSRWFTRGWTLQELLAPAVLEFFSKQGQLLGRRSELVSLLSEITTIPSSAFQGTPLSDFPAKDRMRWASARKTTKPEDRAYCLLGIFGVSMGSNYGEGFRKAKIRLIEEIGKSQTNELLSIEYSHPESSISIPNDIASSSAPSTAVQTGQSLDYWTKILEFLGFAQMNARRETIRPAYSKTCLWLPCHSAYMDWLDPQKYAQHHGFLWIKGKPGAGKSTLIKYALGKAVESPRHHRIILSFFFNARGDVLEKSTSGMYRSLLCQLLPKLDIPRAFDGILISDAWAVDELSSDFWKIDQLRELFTFAISHLQEHSVECYIDALDECDEQEIRDMIAHFDGLGQISNRQFHACLASRHYPTIVVPNGIQISLEDESGHGEDLAEYIRKRLTIGSGKARKELQTQVQLRANGVFLWAVLVIDILNNESRHGSIFYVKRRLSEIPTELSKLFEDILLRDHGRREHLLLCVQWVLFAKRPLRLEEFYFAMAAGLTEEFVGDWDTELIAVESMKRYVSDSSKGLAELTKSKPPTVQFIHESVRDFLLKDGGLCKLWPELGPDPQSISNSELSKCCQRSLAVDLTQYKPTPVKQEMSAGEIKRFRTLMDKKLPFLRYAADYVLHHTNESARRMTANDLLSEFDFSNWISVYNSLEHRQNHRLTQNAPLMYVFAAQNSAWLIRKLLQQDATIPLTPREYYRHPLLAAIAHKCWDAARAILEPSGHPDLDDVLSALESQGDASVGKDSCPLHWAIRSGCIPLAQMLIDSSPGDLSVVNKIGQTALSLAAEKGHETIVDLLLSKGAVVAPVRTGLYHAAKNGHTKVVKLFLDKGTDVNFREHTYDTSLLQAASYEGRQEVVRLLLDAGADVNAQGGRHGPALHAASVRGRPEVVKLLLNAGADVNSQKVGGNSALQGASFGGLDYFGSISQIRAKAGSSPCALYSASREDFQEVVQLLLDAGADVNAQGSYRSNALYNASQEGHREIAKLLLDAGADVNAQEAGVNAQGGIYGNALQAASRRGHQEVVRLLLNAGANVNAQGGMYGNALQAASQKGHREVVRLLLDAGADVNAQGGKYGNALQAASREGYREIAKLLLDAGADVNAQGGKYGNALQAASREGHREVTKLLLDAGADVATS